MSTPLQFTPFIPEVISPTLILFGELPYKSLSSKTFFVETEYLGVIGIVQPTSNSKDTGSNNYKKFHSSFLLLGNCALYEALR